MSDISDSLAVLSGMLPDGSSDENIYISVTSPALSGDSATVSVVSLVDVPGRRDSEVAAQRLAVLSVQSYSADYPRVNKRKQGHPHRAIKQLASLAEKIINGIVVIEPRMPWEDEDSYPKTNFQAVPVIVKSASKSSNQSSGSSRRRRRDENKGVPDSPASQSSGRSPSPSPAGRDLSPANNPNSKPTVIIGKHCGGDFDSEKLAARMQLYENIYRKRKTPGSLAALGSNRLSGFGGTPLDISQSPGSCLLDEVEFELCSLLRLQPLQYFQSRDTLIKNYHERGFYKKSAAQKMLHIDVNKTGRLYDFFVKMGWMPETEDPAAASSIIEPPYVNWEQLLP